jgi:hypothetical protein
MVFALAALFAFPAMSQQTEEQKGIDQGNYNIKQSIEFGGRITSITGDLQAYDTMVNLQEGPRLLNFTTEMRSLDHHATFFDRLYFSNFGYGGDPNVVSILRVSKNKWYAFDAMFRHDENFWDYSLLANPYNPAAPAVANAPANFNPLVNAPRNVVGTALVGTSPHYYNTRRNMQNYGVTFLPDSKIRVRLGYNYNTNKGPTFSTIHQGTEQFLAQNFSGTLTQYRLGIDFRFLPRTNISYDQTWSYYKTDPGITDENQQFSVGSGFPLVDLGVSWSPPGTPCNPTFNAGSIVNPKCSGYYDYFTHYRTRLNFPTEQISFQSSFIPTVQMSGQFSYTGGDMNQYNYQQSYAGFESRSQATNFLETGPMQGRHVTSYGDFGATWKITPIVSIVESFHYGNWMEPGQFIASQCSFFSTDLITPPNLFAPTASLPFAACTAPSNGVPGTPNHKSGSAPDMLVNIDSNFLKQKIYNNLIEGQMELSSKAGAYFGYRYTHREIADNFLNIQNAIYFPNNAARGNCTLLDTTLPPTQSNLPGGCTLNGDGSISFQTPGASLGPPGETFIRSNSAVLGFWLRPTRNLNFNLDAELTSSDKTFTRVNPLQSQQVRFRMQYKPANWANLTFNASTLNGQNNVETVNGLQKNWNVGFTLGLMPSPKFSAQLGFNYNGISSQILVCYTSSAALPGLPACPDLSGLLQQLAVYSSKVSTGFFDFTWTPVRRLTLDVGANLSAATGSELNLAPESPIAVTPTGALNSNWYQPYGSITYQFASHWSGKALWDYYGYHEDTDGSYQDLYAPRNFHGNLVTLSVRFAF